MRLWYMPMYKSSQYKSGDNCMNKAHHCWGYGKCLCTRVHNIKVVTIAWIKHIAVEVMVNAYVQEFTI